MLFDVFYVKYEVDKADTEKAIDAVTNKAEKARKATESAGDKGIKSVEDAAKGASDSMNRAGDSADKFHQKLEKVKDGAIKVKGILGQIGDVGSMISKGGVQKVLSAGMEHAQSLMRKPSAAYGAGGEEVGATAAEAAAGSGGMTAGGLMARSLALLGGPVALIAAAVAAVAAAGAWGVKSGHVIAKASEEKYGSTKKDAWAAGMNTQGLLKHQIAGENLGISREDSLKGLSGLNEKIKEVALHRAQPMGGIDMRTGIDTNPLSRLMRSRGIKIQTGKHLEGMDQIWKVIVDDLRTAAQKQGTNYALARATQQYGLDFNQASKIIEATSDQVKDMNKGIEQQAIQETILAQSTRNYTAEQASLKVEQEKTETIIRSRVVPGMVAWSKETVALEKNMRPVNTLMSVLKRLMIDMSTGALHMLNSSIEGIVSLGSKLKDLPDMLDGLGDRMSLSLEKGINHMMGKIPAALGGKTQEEVDAADKEIDVKGKGYEDLRKKEKEAQAKQKEADYQKSATESFNENIGEFQKRYGKVDDSKMAELRKQFADMAQKGDVNLNDNELVISALQTLVGTSKEGLQANDAQFQVEKEKLSQIVTNTSVGLEQAIAMWASGIGRAGGLGTPDAGIEGQSRADFEKRSRVLRFTPDPAVMRMGMASSLNAQKQAGAMPVPEAPGPRFIAAAPTEHTPSRESASDSMSRANDAMRNANDAAAKGVRMTEASRASAQPANAPQPGGIHIGEVNVDVKSDEPKNFGERLGKEINDVIGAMNKQIANVHDGIFKG